nr:peptidyl-prolyl cis-trans isomerase CYP38, chloroplastic [Tanacetum cinerariifolium]
VAVAAADWWLSVTASQSPIDGVNSSTGCLSGCGFVVFHCRGLGMVTLLGCRLEWCFFSSVNGANLFQVAGDVESEAEPDRFDYLAESKKDHAIELLTNLEVGMDELQKIIEYRKREVVVPKQKELLQYVGRIMRHCGGMSFRHCNGRCECQWRLEGNVKATEALNWKK